MQGLLKKLRPLWWVVSPTRMCVSSSFRSDDPGHNGKVLRKASIRYLGVEVALCVVILALPESLNSVVRIPICFLASVWASSRCFVIAFAFYSDAQQGLNAKPRRSDLSGGERVHMAMRSYLGLSINFALLYFFISLIWHMTGQTETIFETSQAQPTSNEPLSFFDAVYFSGVTITTLGYGDIQPRHWISRSLVLCEVYLGIFLLVVAIGTYISSTSNPYEGKKAARNSDELPKISE